VILILILILILIHTHTNAYAHTNTNSSKDEILDIVDIIIEAWVYLPNEPYDMISKVVDCILAFKPSHPSANIGKSFGYIEEGLVFSCTTYAMHCMNHWTSNKATEKGTITITITITIIIAVTTTITIAITITISLYYRKH
jgi:hypothetical protein